VKKENGTAEHAEYADSERRRRGQSPQAHRPDPVRHCCFLRVPRVPRFHFPRCLGCQFSDRGHGVEKDYQPDRSRLYGPLMQQAARGQYARTEHQAVVVAARRRTFAALGLSGPRLVARAKLEQGQSGYARQRPGTGPGRLPVQPELRPLTGCDTDNRYGICHRVRTM